MVEYNKNLDLIFHALADSTRRSLLNDLQTQDFRVTDLAKNYDVSLNAISKHIKVLEKANLIERKILGRTHHCKLNSEKLKDVEKWMAPYKEFWTQSLDNLEDYLIAQKGEK